MVVAYPNFFGRLEDVAGAIAERAHDAGALVVAVSDPTAMGVLESPGELGADVVAAEGHALGNPMAYGGPYVGLFATKLDLVRQVPGRIAGETLDADDRRAFVLTLQGREQHIRRAKATSNVCTNQTLMAIAAADPPVVARAGGPQATGRDLRPPDRVRRPTSQRTPRLQSPVRRPALQGSGARDADRRGESWPKLSRGAVSSPVRRWVGGIRSCPTAC